MSGVSTLAGEKYISLTTFKQDGTPVATPVWVVSDDGRRLLVWTGPQTWKSAAVENQRPTCSDFRRRRSRCTQPAPAAFGSRFAKFR